VRGQGAAVQWRRQRTCEVEEVLRGEAPPW
jgi:hypothetical protein